MPLYSRLRPDIRDRQTDRQTSRQKHRLMPPPIRDGGIIIVVWIHLDTCIRCAQRAASERQYCSTHPHYPPWTQVECALELKTADSRICSASEDSDPDPHFLGLCRSQQAIKHCSWTSPRTSSLRLPDLDLALPRLKIWNATLRTLQVGHIWLHVTLGVFRVGPPAPPDDRFWQTLTFFRNPNVVFESTYSFRVTTRVVVSVSKSRSRDVPYVSSRLGGIFQCLGLVSVSRLNVSGLVSVSAMKVSSASLSTSVMVMNI